jgi:hypothetical protein
LADLDNSTSFGYLWDQYRIDAIVCTIRPQNFAVGLFTNSTTSLSDFYSVIDYDDATALGSTTAAREYDNCMTLTPGESGMRVFTPRMALAAYAGAFTSYANSEPMWIDMVSGNVQHYGLKIVIPQGTAAQTQLQVWELTFEYYVSFRSVR